MQKANDPLMSMHAKHLNNACMACVTNEKASTPSVGHDILDFDGLLSDKHTNSHQLVIPLTYTMTLKKNSYSFKQSTSLSIQDERHAKLLSFTFLLKESHMSFMVLNIKS
jgi:hypothetical protein